MNYRIESLIFTLCCLTSCGTSVGSYYSPDYNVEKKDGSFELRTYTSARAVSNTASSDNSAFRPLFNYISGENEQEQKISMTVPVRRKLDSENPNLSFFLPEPFNHDVPPQPKADSIRIEEYPGGTFAVHRFSGLISEEKLVEKRDALKAWLESQSYTVVGQWYLDRFDPPWTLWFMRKNEILVRVE